LQLFHNNKFFELSSNKELIKLCEIDTRIIDINERENLDVSEINNIITDNNDSEIESNEEMVFKGRNSKYPKRVSFCLFVVLNE
jgi:hypothetical protein